MKYLSWEESYLLACSYYEINGDLIVGNNYITENGYNLGNWIYNQRRFYKRGKLSQDKIDLLNSIGMIWDSFENAWKIMYYESKKVFDYYGYIDICDIDEKLSVWLRKQEKLYADNELEEWKKELLDNIYIKDNFLCKKNIKPTWNSIYELAKQYYEENNTLIIPRSYTVILNNKIINLGKWINTQRDYYNRNILDQEKINLLNEIGMVWQVRAKREGLEWNTWYNYAMMFYEKNNHLNVPSDYYVDMKYNLSSWLRRQKKLMLEGKLTSEQIDKLNKIRINWTIKERKYFNHNWDDVYLSAVSYYKDNGDLFVPIDYVDDIGYPLGKWLNNQRKERKLGNLSSEQITKLDDIGMIWNSYNTLTKITWEAAYEYAKEYYLEFGNLLVKREYVTEDGYKLGRWINTQRTYKSAGKLSNEKIKLLDSIGMIWVINPEQERIDWNIAFECIKKYYEYYNNLNIDTLFKTDESYPKSNYYLGKWLAHQKFLYHHKQLSNDKIEKLNSLNIDWKLNNKMSWELIYATAKQYYEENGNLTPPFNYKTDDHYYIKDFNLYEWLARQRSLYVRGLLSKKKFDKLESIGMVWNLNDKNWNEMFNYLRLSLLDESKVDLNTLKKVRSWLSTQKHLYISGELNSDRECKLLELGIKLEVSDKKSWIESYEYAKKYYDTHGNISISTSYVTNDGYGLGQWVYNVKKAYRNGTLEQEKIELMNKLDIIWEKLPSEWDLCFNKAKEYYKVHGNLDVDKKYVTEDGFNLGKWVYGQKINHNNNSLIQEKIERLESIGIKWLESRYLSWKEAYALAFKYYEEHCNLRITEDLYEGYTLAKWIRVQRTYYKKGILEEEKIQLLNDIGMIWDIGLNKYKIKEICDEFDIKYYLNKKSLKNISYKELYAKLKYYRDNNITYLDNNNLLTSNVFISSIEFNEQFGISIREIINKDESYKVLKLH